MPYEYRLHIKQEIQYVAVFHNVIFTFCAHFTGFFCTLFAFVLDEILKCDGLGADKAFFKVGVDFTGCLRGGCADRDSPCTDFFHTGGEIGLQVKQGVTGADHAVQARFFDTEVSHKLFAVTILQLSDIGFDCRAYRHHN